jgi:hypothetical protein
MDSDGPFSTRIDRMWSNDGRDRVWGHHIVGSTESNLML